MQSHDHDERSGSPDRTSDPSSRIRSMHDIFDDPYRCAVLYHLQVTDEPATLDEIADAVVESCPDGKGLEDEHEVRDWLLDGHVRQMSEFGVLSYDEARDVVRVREDVSISVTSPWEDA